jgi:hypothetical protein
VFFFLVINEGNETSTNDLASFMNGDDSTPAIISGDDSPSFRKRIRFLYYLH